MIWLVEGTDLDSVHEKKADAQLRAQEIDIELARETFVDPRDGRISLAD